MNYYLVHFFLYVQCLICIVGLFFSFDGYIMWTNIYSSQLFLFWIPTLSNKWSILYDPNKFSDLEKSINLKFPNGSLCNFLPCIFAQSSLILFSILSLSFAPLGDSQHSPATHSNKFASSIVANRQLSAGWTVINVWFGYPTCFLLHDTLTFGSACATTACRTAAASASRLCVICICRWQTESHPPCPTSCTPSLHSPLSASLHAVFTAIHPRASSATSLLRMRRVRRATCLVQLVPWFIESEICQSFD